MLNASPRSSPSPHASQCERGAVLVEFALVAFVFYLLLASIGAFGSMLHSAQLAQDVARLAARELALAPLPADATFEEAIDLTRDRVFDRDALVIDLDALADAGVTLGDYVAGLPLVNRALFPAFVFEQALGRRLLHAPGALLASPVTTAFNAGLTVGVPSVVARADGLETVRWLGVVEEIRPTSDPASGSFSAAATGADQGVVALRINVPVAAAGLVAYRAPGTWPPEPNAGAPIVVGEVAVIAGGEPQYGTLLSDAGDGLGALAAYGVSVRPFRRVFSGQAFFRREVFR